MTKKKFTSKTTKALGRYVYTYQDPRDGKVFYVGRGTGNRAFSHLDSLEDSAKKQRICDIREAGLTPEIEIIRHGLSVEEAIISEAVAIDLLGVGDLTNKVRGYGSRKFGRMSVDQVEQLYGAKPVLITEPGILFKVSQSFRFGMNNLELYEITRGRWVVGPRKEYAKYGFAIYLDVIQEVYEIMGWYPAYSTLMAKDEVGGSDDTGRWEFVGRIAEDVREKYVGKSLADAQKMGRKEFNYVNA